MNSSEQFNVSEAMMSKEIIAAGRNEVDLYPEHEFKVQKKLITVDAPDGSGKGAFAESIFRQLSAIHGENRVVLVQPTRFELSGKGMELLTKLKTQKGLSSDSVRHNLHFMAALMANYQDIISVALNDGKIVIADSSEIRSLAFMLDRGTEATIRSTLRWIKSGRATNNIAAGNRVFINTPPEDCLSNILSRGKVDYGDPTTQVEAIRRDNCYKLAIEMFGRLKQDVPSNIINIANPRVETPEIKKHIDQLVADKIIPKIIV